MTTYSKRLFNLYRLVDREVEPRFFKEYMAEIKEIKVKLKAWPGPNGVEPDQHIPIKIICDHPDCLQPGIYLIKITNQSIPEDLITAAIVACEEHFDRATGIAYETVN